MIVTRFIIILLFNLVRKMSCNGDENLSNSPLNAANSTVNFTSDEVTETHHTSCKITTEKLVANAQATFTRVFTGACNAKIIDERFEKLENLINNRLDKIEKLLASNRWDSTDSINVDFREKRIIVENKKLPKMAVDNNLKNIEKNVLSRRDEVRRFNNTIHNISTSDDERKVYTYYWRVSEIREKLINWKTGRSERSSTFYAGNFGYAMYLKFTPKYFPDGTIFISVGLTKGFHDSKLVWPFPLKIQIKILDLSMRNDPKDRSSRLWDPTTVCSAVFWGRPNVFGESDNPECVGLSVPRHLLFFGGQTRNSANVQNSTMINETYIWEDSLLIQLMVYL